MHQKALRTWGILVVLAAALAPVHAAEVKLHGVQFPEKRSVELTLAATPIAPTARISADVDYRRGQARIDMTYYSIKPAILFGGDVTCFVVWAVTRDGQAENLGELLTRRLSGSLKFSTGKKNFALMVTAESFYLVGQPSELVVFTNTPTTVDGMKSTPFVFDNLVPAPRHSMDAIAHIRWDSKVPLELLQARKAFELATRHEAQLHASAIYTEAGAALKRANAFAASAPKSRDLLDTARRAVALSNEALNISMHRIEALELERQIAARRAETEDLERRAREAEAAAAGARRLAEEIRTERQRMLTETTALRNEKTSLESTMVTLRQEKTLLQGEAQRLVREKAEMERESAGLSHEKTVLEDEARRLQTEKIALEDESRRLRAEKSALESESLRLQRDKDQLSGRLQAALSSVADTQETVRGFVINLPDILFDLNEATLKHQAQLALAKLAGILLIMPEQGATIEGHTDSTGSATHNLDLSQRRANAVLYFLQVQGLDSGRLRAVGYGMQRPVADNSAAEGRRRNRRVEIIISGTSKAIALN